MYRFKTQNSLSIKDAVLAVTSESFPKYYKD